MNKITITIDGVEYIARPKEEPETVAEDTPKTGYERAENEEDYFYMLHDGRVNNTTEDCAIYDDNMCMAANYYNDATIAENNARADRLMRKLRQWQALNDNPVDWSDEKQLKHAICYDYMNEALYVAEHAVFRQISAIYFSTREKALEAIKVFRDELTWYFTEYMQRLDEPGRLKVND